MPLHLPELALVPDEEDGEPAAAVYDAVAATIRELPQASLVDLVGAVQRGDPWPRLPLHVRAAFVALASRLYDEPEEDDDGEG